MKLKFSDTSNIIRYNHMSEVFNVCCEQRSMSEPNINGEN